jgi:hypothetical protein
MSETQDLRKKIDQKNSPSSTHNPHRFSVGQASCYLENCINFFSNSNCDTAHMKELSTDDLEKHLSERGVRPYNIRLAVSSYVKHLTNRDFDYLVK